MAVINHSKREINAKIVLYGPPDSGKDSLFRFIHRRIKPSLCSPLKSMVTGGDTLLFFDYTPFESSSLDGYRVCFHLYTLTGQADNPGTWKMLLKGVDGIALITGKSPLAPTTFNPLLANLRAMLGSYGRGTGNLPMVVLSDQENGAPTALDQLAPELSGIPLFANSASNREGALSALAELSRQVMAELRKLHGAEKETQLYTSSTKAVDNRDKTAAEAAPPLAADSLPAAILEPGVLTTLRIPVRIRVDGNELRYTLCATLKLEAEDGN